MKIDFRAKKIQTKMEGSLMKCRNAGTPEVTHYKRAVGMCEWQEEMRVSSDDSCESVMPLATRVMQAHAAKAFLINSSEILETAI